MPEAGSGSGELATDFSIAPERRRRAVRGIAPPHLITKDWGPTTGHGLQSPPITDVRKQLTMTGNACFNHLAVCARPIKTCIPIFPAPTAWKRMRFPVRAFSPTETYWNQPTIALEEITHLQWQDLWRKRSSHSTPLHCSWLLAMLVPRSCWNRSWYILRTETGQFSRGTDLDSLGLYCCGNGIMRK